jgi:hypothetical protein
VSVVVTAFCLIVVGGMIAFALDLGYIVLVRTQLQVAADSAAMAASSMIGDGAVIARDVAKQYAANHVAGGEPVRLADADIEFGIWDMTTRSFTPGSDMGNAVRVTARRTATSTDGEADLFFAPIFGRDRFSTSASAIAMANPRDIAFVVDLSGSMNDDTEPQWVTDAINAKFAPDGYPTVGTELMQDLYDDFGWGTYPGTLEYIGAPLGVSTNSYALAEMTKDNGPLTDVSIPLAYRIVSGTINTPVDGETTYTTGDDEATRKWKAYRWIIDYQIARVMPNALPAPDSSINYSYWEKYLDYIMRAAYVNHRPPWEPPPPPPPPPEDPPPEEDPPPPAEDPPPEEDPPPPPPPPPPKPPVLGSWGLDSGRLLAMSPTHMGAATTLPRLLLGSSDPAGTPPYRRGWVPVNQDGDRIYRFNNPNKYTFPSVSSSVTYGLRNHIGYLTYAAFVMDHGRNLQPDGTEYAPISRNSPHCPFHSESTPGGTFSFPPRSQPMHAARRAIIAAIAYIDSKNNLIPNVDHRDWVSIISFDSLSDGGPIIERSLTGNYEPAMRAATYLQAVGDKNATTATEAGLFVAREHIKKRSQGGLGREQTNKVIVLLTDGVPNLWSAADSDIDAYVAAEPTAGFYGGGYYWLDAALIKAHQVRDDRWLVHPVGIGLGADYDFMDRMAQIGGTADAAGQSPRGSGNPAEYEQRLVEIFGDIIDNPAVRLVE